MLIKKTLQAFVEEGSYFKNNSVTVVEKTVKEMAGRIGSTVSYLHTYGFILRELVATNILVSKFEEVHYPLINNIWKFSVHGPGEFTNEDYAHEEMATKAPEVIQGLPYSQKADCWSFGVILYFMLTQRHPFAVDPQTDFKQKINKQLE